MKLVLLITLLLTVVSLSDEKYPVTHQGKISKDILEPWKTDHWSCYSGIYEALEVDGTASARVVLTAFAGAKDAKLISACMIVVPDLFVEPSYQIHGSITPNEKTGELEAYSIDDWRMIRYIDPNTKDDVFGISIDGRIYVDSSKTKRAQEDAAEQPATAGESKRVERKESKPEPDGRAR